MAIRTTRSWAYGEISAGSTASSTTSAAGTRKPPGSRRAMSGSSPTSAARPSPASGVASVATLHQPLGPPDEHHGHQQVDADAAPFGEEHLAESVDDADQERGDQ